MDTPAKIKQGWIFGPIADVSVFIGAIALSFLFLFFNQVGWFGFNDFTLGPTQYGGHTYFIQTFINMAHVYFAYWFTYASVREWKKFKNWFIAVPIIAFVCCFSFGYFFGFWYLHIVFAHMTMWHFVKQQQAWFYISSAQGPSRDKTTIWIDKIAIIAATAGFMATSQSKEHSIGWFLPGDIIEFPVWMYEPFLYTTCTIIAFYFFWHTRRYLKGHSMNWPAHFYMLFAVLIWGGIRLFITGPLPYYLSQLCHSIPYFYLGYRYMKTQREQGVAYFFPKAPVWALSITFIVLSAFIGHVDHQFKFSWLPNNTWDWSYIRYLAVWAFFDATNITHYTMDKFVWDRKHNPEWTNVLHK